MGRVREHARVLSSLAFCLLAFIAELAGRWLTASIDVGRHVRSPGDASAEYYPFLLAGVKLCTALLLARLAWRLFKARATAAAACRALGSAASRRTAPRPTLRLSPRLWLAFFTVTSLMYLVQTDAEHAADGRWPVLSPWLHSSALPMFAVLAVVLAIVWHGVQRWLADYEQFAEAVADQALRMAVRTASPAVCTHTFVRPPRRLFGIVFDCRPPPLRA